MARRPRSDAPGSWHHVGNRAIAKRPYFESRSDQRSFLALLAAQVRGGRLEVHAYCLMATHFHLLVRSPIGELSEGMRRLQNTYSRHFNRRQRRDGPLIRSRYFSKRVDSQRYRRAVVRYIDANPVRARMVANAAEYEFGSANAHLRERRPPWLCGDWIVPEALALSGRPSFDPAAYLEAFGLGPGRATEAVIELVEERLRSAQDADPIDDLVGRTPSEVRAWLARKARLADGHTIGLPVCGPSSITRAVTRDVARNGDCVLRHGRHAWCGSEVMQVGLLRDLAALPIDRVGRLAGLRRNATARRLELHRQHLEQDEDYRRRVGLVAKAAVDDLA